MTAPKSELIGLWRIFESDLWDQEFLDLVEPAHIWFGRDGDGELGFGAVEGQMDLRYGHRVARFTWAGFDEGDEVGGAGTARLEDDGTLAIELSFHLGDDAVLKARRE